jgi:hypothetical protein
MSIFEEVPEDVDGKAPGAAQLPKNNTDTAAAVIRRSRSKNRISSLLFSCFGFHYRLENNILSI